MDYLLATLLMLAGIFMILLVLIQRGRGGGLAGAFGGMGGQSAFGTKAGDVFTKITVGVATFWVLLAGFSILSFRAAATGGYSGGQKANAAGPTVESADEEGGAGAGLTIPESDAETEGSDSTESTDAADGAAAPTDGESGDAAESPADSDKK